MPQVLASIDTGDFYVQYSAEPYTMASFLY